MDNKKEIIVLGGGCFWCTEAVFRMLKGIVSVTPGYAGGVKSNPSYEDICAGGTGHAEVIRIEYDASIINFETLLTVFFATHDPTTPNRQGNDVGEQYRSVILYTTGEQKEIAEKFIDDLNKSNSGGKPIVTKIKPLDKFYEAEDEHKDYYAKNPKQAYCQVVINPKLQKVQEKFSKILKSS